MFFVAFRFSALSASYFRVYFDSEYKFTTAFIPFHIKQYNGDLHIAVSTLNFGTAIKKVSFKMI